MDNHIFYGVIKKNLLWQLFLFGITGIIGFLVDSATLYLAQNYVGIYYGRIISFPIAVFVTWLLNRTITFTKKLKRNVFMEFAYYLWCMLFGGIANLMTYYILTHQYDYIYYHPIIAVALGSISGMIINFISSKFLVFKS